MSDPVALSVRAKVDSSADWFATTHECFSRVVPAVPMNLFSI